MAGRLATCACLALIFLPAQAWQPPVFRNWRQGPRAGISGGDFRGGGGNGGMGGWGDHAFGPEWGDNENGEWRMLGIVGATAVTVPGFLSKNWPPRCQEIIAPNSTVLTKELLEELCDVMRLRGQRLDKAKLKAIIRSLDRYYQGNGYFLSHVRTAYAHDNGSVVLDVEEKKVSSSTPVELRFHRIEYPEEAEKRIKKESKKQAAQAIAPPPATAEKKEKSWWPAKSGKAIEPPKAAGPPSPPPQLLPPSETGASLVPHKGRTRAKVVQEALRLQRGQPFKLDMGRLAKLKRLGPFENFAINLVLNADDTITVELDVIERPNFVLEPGLSHSLYTKHWNADVVFDDRNFLGRNQMLSLHMHAGIKNGRASPHLNVHVDFNESPLKQGVVPGFSAYRDLVDDESVREGGRVRFGIPMPGPLRASLDFAADKVTHVFGRERVTAVGADTGVAFEFFGGRQDLAVSGKTGLCSERGRSAEDKKRQGFSKLMVVSTVSQPFWKDRFTLANRHVGVLASPHTPEYVAYHMGEGFYVRGYDEFEPFGSLTGGTTELRIPLLASEGSGKLGLTGFFFLDYAAGRRLPKRLSLFSPLNSSPSSSSTAPSPSKSKSKKVPRPGAPKHYLSGGVGIRVGPIRLEWAHAADRDSRMSVGLVDPTF